MSKFLKLTSFLLNVNDIHKIVIHPNKYYIHIVSKKINGSNVNIYHFGMGIISSYTSEIEVCKIKHSTDYEIVTDWISKN